MEIRVRLKNMKRIIILLTLMLLLLSSSSSQDNADFNQAEFENNAKDNLLQLISDLNNYDIEFEAKYINEPLVIECFLDEEELDSTKNKTQQLLLSVLDEKLSANLKNWKNVSLSFDGNSNSILEYSLEFYFEEHIREDDFSIEYSVFIVFKKDSENDRYLLSEIYCAG